VFGSSPALGGSPIGSVRGSSPPAGGAVFGSSPAGRSGRAVGSLGAVGGDGDEDRGSMGDAEIRAIIMAKRKQEGLDAYAPLTASHYSTSLSQH
jgi:hypothetical protein